MATAKAKTPVVASIQYQGGEIRVHAATLGLVLAVSKAQGLAEIEAADAVLDACVELPEGAEGRPSEVLPASVASKALQAATAGEPGPDFTGA